MTDNIKTKPSQYDDKIFDSSFATMVEEFPTLLIPVINEVFGTNYSKNDSIILSRDRHHKKKGYIETDVLVEICGMRYHIECQSYEDGTMRIRMLEYDLAIAIENTKHNKDYEEVTFPKSCVLQLRSKENAPDKLKVKLNFQDGSSAEYSVPVVNVNDYSYKEMFDKKLLMLIPFYIMRYEDVIKDNDEKELSKLYEDTVEILEKLRTHEKTETAYTLIVIVEMFEKICYYISRGNNVCDERMDEIMSDNPLNLESIKIGHQIKAEAKQESILELLEDYGEVSDELKSIISNQKDFQMLKNWMKLAAKANSIEEFETEIGLVK
jgi:hypothetical protein